MVVPPSESTGRSTTWPHDEGLARIYPLDGRRRRIGMTLDPQPGAEGLIQLMTEAGLAGTNGTDREPLDEAD